MKAYPWSLDGMPPADNATIAGGGGLSSAILPTVVIYLMVATLVAVVLYPHMVVTVPSGHVGVLWKRFGGGTVLDPRQLRDEGLHLIWPWDELFLYDLRLQSVTETYNAISRDGVSLTATINIRFRLKRDAIPVLHQAIGPNYVQVLARPESAAGCARSLPNTPPSRSIRRNARKFRTRSASRTVEKLGEKMMEREGEESYNVSMKDIDQPL